MATKSNAEKKLGKRAKKNKQKVTMPMCEYGAACSRKDCVYRHPPKESVKKESTQSRVICVQYLSGECAFGSLCRNRHLEGEGAKAIVDKFKATPCRWGATCRNSNCLYAHPKDRGVTPAGVTSTAATQSQVETKVPNQTMPPPPQSLVEAMANRTTHPYVEKTGTAIVNGDPTQPEFAGITPPLLDPFGQLNINGTVMGETSGAPVDRDERRERLQFGWGVNDSQSQSLFDNFLMPTQNRPTESPFPHPQQETIQNHVDFQQFPTHQQHYAFNPPFHTSHSLPWSQESQRQENHQPQHEQAHVPSKPATLAEIVASTASNSSSANVSVSPSWGAAGSTKRAGNAQRRIPTVRIPTELWISSQERDPDAFRISDPLERFWHVNANSKPGVLDMHFQTSLTAADVLDHILPTTAFYEIDEKEPNMGYVWIFTGTGHHTAQRLAKLYDVVVDYLEQNGYSYSIGKDGRNRQSGALYVRIKR